jgi:hypothetical protein
MLGGQWHILSHLPNLEGGVAYSVNDKDEVVGCSESHVTLKIACLWAEGKIIRLDDQINPRSHWKLQVATSINNRGEIAGIGLHYGRERVFLLRPIG